MLPPPTWRSPRRQIGRPEQSKRQLTTFANLPAVATALYPVHVYKKEVPESIGTPVVEMLFTAPICLRSLYIIAIKNKELNNPTYNRGYVHKVERKRYRTSRATFRLS